MLSVPTGFPVSMARGQMVKPPDAPGSQVLSPPPHPRGAAVPIPWFQEGRPDAHPRAASVWPPPPPSPLPFLHSKQSLRMEHFPEMVPRCPLSWVGLGGRLRLPWGCPDKPSMPHSDCPRVSSTYQRPRLKTGLPGARWW